MNDWENLRVLLAVLESGSLGGAAQRLSVSPATVGRRLTALDDELGTVVVERGPGGVRITEAGQAMLAALRDAERALTRARQLASNRDVGGLVRVASLRSTAADLICPHLPDFYASHPDIQIQLMVSHEVVNLGRGDADIAIRSLRPTQQNLVMKQLPTPPIVPMIAASILRRHGNGSVDVRDLPWVAWPEDANIMEVRWFQQHVPKAQIVLRVDDLHAQARACQAGVGATLLPASLRGIYSGIRIIPGAPEGFTLPLWLVSPEAVRSLPRVAAVWSFIDGLFDRLFRHQ
ncbi:MAG: LysR family transcriptional regulator [Myxococcota bacterium]